MPHMRPTAGITRANLSVDPLATEEEQTPGPSDWNPYDDPNVSEDELAGLDLAGRPPTTIGDYGFEPELPRF